MKQEIVDHGDPRKYYAAIPKIVLKLGLNPYELALYVHLKDAAGDKGVCFKSRATLAKECNMSPGMVTKARQALTVAREELSGRPLITVKDELNKEGGKPRCIVTVTDIWLTNMQRFTTSPHDVADSSTGLTTSPDERATSPYTDQRHHTTSQRHTAATKNSKEEELTKKNPEETVFCFWREHLNHPRAVFDEKRRKAVAARLRAGYSVDDLILAVRGCKLTPHNMGANERQEIYDDLELICRDTSHVERFIARAENGANGNGTSYAIPRTASDRNVVNLRASMDIIRKRSGQDNSQEPSSLVSAGSEPRRISSGS